MERQRNLLASNAAARLGVSVKALRVWEHAGLIAPGRSRNGWRVFTPANMARAKTIAALRRLGLSLAAIAELLAGAPDALAAALAARQGALAAQAVTVEQALLLAHEQGRRCAAQDGYPVGFALPWPWNGERFELGCPAPLTFITGPLGSGKTRFAEALAAALPGGAFLDLGRTLGGPIAPAVERRVAYALEGLAGDGALPSAALTALVTGIEAGMAGPLVVDLVEHDLDAATQRAVIAWLRASAGERAPLFLMTRSTAILDLSAVRAEEVVFVCPANHAPPFRAATRAGGIGYEAAATCLAAPAVRARTAGLRVAAA